MRKKLTIVCLALVALAPIAAQAELAGWFEPSALKVLRDAKAPQAPAPVDLAACRGEVEACQIVLLADAPISGVVVSATDFVNAQGGTGAKASLYKVAYVPNIVGETAYPDPLPPLTSLDLQPGQAQPVWIQARVAKDAAPGDYTATVTVKAGDKTLTYTLALHVWNFALPETPSGTTAFGINGTFIAQQHGVAENSEDAKRLYALYYEMLLDHRVSAYGIPVDIMTDDAAKYLDDPRMTSFVPPYSENDDELKALVKRLVRNKWYAKSCFYPIDEPIKKDAYDRIAQIGERLRKLAPGYRWVVPFFRRPEFDGNATPYDLLMGQVNAWCPSSQYFDSEEKARAFLAERRELGESVWWYVCCGPGEPYANFFVQMTAMAHRMLFWQQKRENVQGLLYWCTTYWSPSSTEDPWKSMMTVKDINESIRGDGSLFYPGKQVGVDGPVSSIRLEMIRDGLEDFDYLTIAEARLGRASIDPMLTQLVRSMKDFEQDPKKLEEARRNLGKMIEESLAERNTMAPVSEGSGIGKEKVMEARISMITLGVSDMSRAYAFYHDGLGFPTSHDPTAGIVFFQTTGTCLALYPKDKLAEDVRPGSRELSDAFTGITLAHNVRNREEVEEVLRLAERAGGTIVKLAQVPPWGGLSGYFADPDGYLWEVAWHSDWQFNEDGSLVIK